MFFSLMLALIKNVHTILNAFNKTWVTGGIHLGCKMKAFLNKNIERFPSNLIDSCF